MSRLQCNWKSIKDLSLYKWISENMNTEKRDYIFTACCRSA